MMLKEKEREDDPMLAYMKQKKKKQDIKAGKKGGTDATLEFSTVRATLVSLALIILKGL